MQLRATFVAFAYISYIGIILTLYTMTLKRLLSDLFRQLIDSLVPPRKTEQKVEALTLEELHEIIRREKAPVYGPEVRTLLPYRNASVKALVWEMKYRKNSHAFMLASAILGEDLIGFGEESIGAPLLIPVPMHEARKRERGYNQTEVLCETILAQAENQGRRSSGGETLGALSEGLSSGNYPLPLQYEPRALARVPP